MALAVLDVVSEMIRATIVERRVMAKRLDTPRPLVRPSPMVSARPVSERSVPSAMPEPKSRIVPQSILTASFQLRVKRRSDQLIGSTTNASGPRKSPDRPTPPLEPLLRRRRAPLAALSSVLYVPPRPYVLAQETLLSPILLLASKYSD